MNLGNSLGGLVLMLLSVVWLAIFVPQWAKSSEEADARGNKRHRETRAASSSSILSASESQLLRLTYTRNRMGAVAAVSGIVGGSLALVSAGTFLAAVGWILVVVGILSGGLSIAASRHITTLALKSKYDRNGQLSRASQAPTVNLKTEPLTKRDWTPPAMPRSIQQVNVGQIVARGNKVVPIRDISAPIKSAPKEIAPNEIDEILRRRRAN
jgi:hypothetical protein